MTSTTKPSNRSLPANMSADSFSMKYGSDYPTMTFHCHSIVCCTIQGVITSLDETLRVLFRSVLPGSSGDSTGIRVKLARSMGFHRPTTCSPSGDSSNTLRWKKVRTPCGSNLMNPVNPSISTWWSFERLLINVNSFPLKKCD